MRNESFEMKTKFEIVAKKRNPSILKNFQIKNIGPLLMFLGAVISFSGMAEKQDDEKLSVLVEKSLQQFDTFYTSFFKIPSDGKKDLSIKLLVDKYYSHLSSSDRKYLVLRLQLYSMSFMERNGSVLHLYADKRVKDSKFWKIDFENAPFGVLVVEDKSYKWDLKQSLEWNFRNKILKDPSFERYEQHSKIDFPKFLLDLVLPDAKAQSCSNQNVQSGINTAGAAAGLVGYATCPTNIAISAGIAVCTGIYKGVKSKSFSTGADTTLKSLPVVKEVNTFVEEYKKNSPPADSH